MSRLLRTALLFALAVPLTLAVTAAAQHAPAAPVAGASVPATPGQAATATAEPTEEQIGKFSKEIDRQVTIMGEREYAKKMATRFKTTPEALNQERQKRKVSWGEMSIAHGIAARSGKPVGEIFAQRDKGMGWGKVAKQNGVNLGEVMRNAEKKRAEMQAAGKGKPQGQGKPEDKGKPESAGGGKSK